MTIVNIKIGQQCFYIDKLGQTIFKAQLHSFISDYEWNIKYKHRNEQTYVNGHLGQNIFLTKKRVMLKFREMKGLTTYISDGERCSVCGAPLNYYNACSCIAKTYNYLFKEN